jgi:hypothetical protein
MGTQLADLQWFFETRDLVEPHDADVDAPIYPPDERLLEKADNFARVHQMLRVTPAMEVPQDYVEAYKWMNLAAARTSGADQKRFADGRDAVAKKMTPDQLSEAQKQAREWMEAFERRKQ